jgi:hypothetical protein
MLGTGFVPWRFRSRHNFVKAHANLFFGFIRKTPPVACQADADVEAHVLVCQRDLNMCLLAAKSFLVQAPNVALIVHEDGTLDASGLELLSHHLPGARVISRGEADQAITQYLPARVASARSNSVWLMKVFDFNYFNAGRRTILLDSDLVFRAAPDEVIAWISGDDQNVFYNPDPMLDTYRAARRPAHPVPDWFNSGFLGFRHRITLEEAVHGIQEMDYWLEDQTVYAYLLAGRASLALDASRYHIYQGGVIPESARMVHFISPNRFTDMAYVKLGKSVCAQGLR